MTKRVARSALRATAALVDDDTTATAQQLLTGTGLDLHTALAVAAGHPAPPGADPTVVAALREGWATTAPKETR